MLISHFVVLAKSACPSPSAAATIVRKNPQATIVAQQNGEVELWRAAREDPAVIG